MAVSWCERGGSSRPALGPKCVDKIDGSRRWVYGVVACFIGASASPGTTVSIWVSSALAVRLLWTSLVGIFAPFMCTICAIRRWGSIYCRAAPVENHMLWPLLVGDNRRSRRSNVVWPTTGWVPVRVEQPSIGLRAIMKHVHAQLRMVGSKHGREPCLKLDCIAACGNSAQTLVGAPRNFIGSDTRVLIFPNQALCSSVTLSTTNMGECQTNMAQQRHRVLAANATELTKVVQVFVKNMQGKSIMINNVTRLTSVEDFKFKVKEKTGMRGVWPELKYQSEWLHDGKTLSAYGIDQGATLEMTWLLLGGGPTPAPAPNSGAAESSPTTGSNIFQLDGNSAAELGPRSHSIWRSIGAADDNANNERDAAREPRAAFVNECAAQQQDATDSRAMAESSGHALLSIMDVRNVESLEDYNEHAADALPQSMEASNVAREAPGLESATLNGANALEASLASESAGVFTTSLMGFVHGRRCVHARTHTEDK